MDRFSGSRSICAAHRCRPVHPHVRGDGYGEWAAASGLIGSPRRAWGRPEKGQLRYQVLRFTPTCVGTAAR